jgi:O-antigen/teichoic acid export membrane protein
LTQKTKRKLFPLVIAVLVLGAATPWLFPLLFGEQWRTAGMFSAILSVQAAAQLFTTPISTMVFILNRQGTQLILDIVRVLLMLGAIGACRYFSADPLYAVLFSSLSMTTVYVVSSIWYHSLVAETSKELQTKPKLCEARVNNTEES